MSPKTTSSRRRTSSPSQSPWPSNGSPSNGSSRTWFTTMPQSMRCSSMHTENTSITPSEKGLSVGQSSSSVSDRSGQPVVGRGQELNTEHAQIRTLLDRQREQILADCQAEIKRHEFQANDDRGSIQKLNETIESQQVELHRAQAEELHRRDQQLLHEQWLEQNSWTSWSSWEKSQRNGRIKAISRLYIRYNFQGENWSKIETLSLNSLARYRNCRMTSIAWMIREILKMLNQYAVDIPTLPVNQCLSHLIQSLGGMLSRSIGMPSRREGPPSIWGHAWKIGKRFCRSSCVLFSTLPAGMESIEFGKSRTDSFHRQRRRMRIGHQFKIRDASQDRRPKIHSSLVRDSLKNYGADQQRLQIFRYSFRQIPCTSNVCLLEDKIQDWGMYVFTISYGSYALDQRSGDGWFSGSSVRGIRMPNFECTRCEDCFSNEQKSSIIPTSKEGSVWRNKKPKKRTVSFVGRQIAHLIYECFRVTEANDSVENYADLFTIGLRNDDIQEFDSKWDGILLLMTKIPPDDILEGWYKLRIRESEKLQTVLELYNLEIHQKKIGADYHRLKTMVKRSIEQTLRIKNFEARNGNYERDAVVKNQGAKQRGQRILGDCWQWEANGQCFWRRQL